MFLFIHFFVYSSVFTDPRNSVANASNASVVWERTGTIQFRNLKWPEYSPSLYIHLHITYSLLCEKKIICEDCLDPYFPETSSADRGGEDEQWGRYPYEYFSNKKCNRLGFWVFQAPLKD